jgi:xanthine dehydrogenase/oxidase
MIQIAANTLQISPNNIFISETATDKVANTPPTAASVSSDTNGMTVYNTCKEIYDRLEPYRTQFPDVNLAKWAQLAHFNRVNLSANGFYKTPDLIYDWVTNTGRIVSYFTIGVSVSTVELDVLTGDSVVLRSDI